MKPPLSLRISDLMDNPKLLGPYFAGPSWDTWRAVLKASFAEKMSAAELQEWLRPKFAKFWIPEAIVFAEMIPRTSAGKFRKSELRERYAGWTWPSGPTSSS